MCDLSTNGYLRLYQIIGDPRTNIQPIIPISKSTWWAGVKTGRYPKPIKISARCTAWPVEKILLLLDQMNRNSGDESIQLEN